jgi:predicted dehydrogenase
MQKILITGFGFMGSLHAQVYQHLRRARLVAVVDENPSVARKKLAGLNLEVPVFDNLDAALAGSKADVVDICVPTPHHPRYLRAAIAAGRHVFCEKPFAATAREARELTALAHRAKIKLQIGHCIRFWPEYQALERYHRSRRGGRLRSLHLYRSSARPAYSVGNWVNREDQSGGAAFDLHIHDTDFVHHLLGAPRAVTSVGTRDNGGWSHIFTTYHFPEVAVTATGGWNYPAQWGFQMGFEAIFERAVIEYDSRAATPLMITEGDGGRRPMPFASPNVASANGGSGNISALGGYFNELRYFVACLERGEHPAIATPEQGTESVRTVLAEIRSAATGRTVRL